MQFAMNADSRMGSRSHAIRLNPDVTVACVGFAGHLAAV
jgi:hypothetical protein